MPNRPHWIRSYDTSYQQVDSRVQDKVPLECVVTRPTCSSQLGIGWFSDAPDDPDQPQCLPWEEIRRSVHRRRKRSLHALHFRIPSSIFLHKLSSPYHSTLSRRSWCSAPRPYITLSVCLPRRSISVLQGSVLQGRRAEPRPPGAGGGGFHCHPANNGLFLGKPRSKTSRSSSLRSLTRGFRDLTTSQTAKSQCLH